MSLLLFQFGLLNNIRYVTGGGYVSIVTLALLTQVGHGSRTHNTWEELEPQVTKS